MFIVKVSWWCKCITSSCITVQSIWRMWYIYDVMKAGLAELCLLDLHLGMVHRSGHHEWNGEQCFLFWLDVLHHCAIYVEALPNWVLIFYQILLTLDKAILVIENHFCIIGSLLPMERWRWRHLICIWGLEPWDPGTRLADSFEEALASC